MIRFIKKYKAFVIGFILTGLLFMLLKLLEFIKVNPHAWLENMIFFLLWWFVISLTIHKFSYLKTKKKLLLKVLTLFLVLVVMISIDSFYAVPDNPATIVLLTVFWLGILYLITPGFFNKYKLPILLVYGSILIYFLYARFGRYYFDYHKQNVVYLLLAPIPIFVLLWLFEQWKWIKSLEQGKKEAELSMLKSQINPHFFFNTLNNLYGLTVEKSDLAPKVVLKLSDMMRYTIYEGRNDMVLLKDEISYLKNYIDLHKMRYVKSVAIEFTHNGDTNKSVAPLLFIILLENAFKHGIETLAEDAYIHISLTENNDKLKFEIENNFDSENEYAPKGIGLDNLKHRLNLIYPKKHRLTIKKEREVFKVILELDIK